MIHANQKPPSKLDPVDFARRYPGALELAVYLDSSRAVLEALAAFEKACTATPRDPAVITMKQRELHAAGRQAALDWTAMMTPKRTEGRSR